MEGSHCESCWAILSLWGSYWPSNTGPSRALVRVAIPTAADWLGKTLQRREDQIQTSPVPVKCTSASGVSAAPVHRKGQTSIPYVPQNMWQPEKTWKGLSSLGPSTQYLRPLVLETTKGMAFATRHLKYWVLGPSLVCRAWDYLHSTGLH